MSDVHEIPIFSFEYTVKHFYDNLFANKFSGNKTMEAIVRIAEMIAIAVIFKILLYNLFMYVNLLTSE